MDHSETFTHLSLCAGYGGIDLGLRRVLPGLRTAAYVEREAFAVANLVAKIEEGRLDWAPLWPDVGTFPYRRFYGRVDILSGGFPCQPFSTCGSRRARKDKRHLFPVIARGIAECQPAIVFLENVEGLLRPCNGGEPVLYDVLRELERIGYTATFGLYSAREVGTPHERRRVFILAHSNSDAGKEVAKSIRSVALGPCLDAGIWPADPSEGSGERETPHLVAKAVRAESGMVGDADVHPARLDEAPLSPFAPVPQNLMQRYRLIGNGVVPAVAALAFRTLISQFD